MPLKRYQISSPFRAADQIKAFNEVYQGNQALKQAAYEQQGGMQVRTDLFNEMSKPIVNVINDKLMSAVPMILNPPRVQAPAAPIAPAATAPTAPAPVAAPKVAKAPTPPAGPAGPAAPAGPSGSQPGSSPSMDRTGLAFKVFQEVLNAASVTRPQADTTAISLTYNAGDLFIGGKHIKYILVATIGNRGSHN